MDLEVKWKIQNDQGHRDYKENLKYAENLSAREDTGKIKLNGLRVKVCDSEHLKKAFLIISWARCDTVKRGNYATPISMHQYSKDFKKTAQNTLNVYKETIASHEVQYPPEFLPTNLKV